MRKRAKQVFVTRELCLSKATALLRKVTSERTSISICIYLFNDNLAAGTSLNGAVLSCHVELGKTQRHRTQKSNSRHKETWKLQRVRSESFTGYRKVVNSMKTATELGIDASATPNKHNHRHGQNSWSVQQGRIWREFYEHYYKVLHEGYCETSKRFHNVGVSRSRIIVEWILLMLQKPMFLPLQVIHLFILHYDSATKH